MVASNLIITINFFQSWSHSRVPWDYTNMSSHLTSAHKVTNHTVYYPAPVSYAEHKTKGSRFHFQIFGMTRLQTQNLPAERWMLYH